MYPLFNRLQSDALLQSTELCRRSFDPKMGPIARVLWQSFPELCHVGAVLVIVALMVAIMGSALFGERAQSFSTLAGMLC